MKKIPALFIFLLFLLFTSCKKDSVDATNTKTMQSSINDMASSLPTLKQVKFNEALYILKTFGVEGDNDIVKLNNLGKLINGKKVPEILALADQVASKNNIVWSSSGPPSLGEMNIFGNENAKEFDPNDVGATNLSIETKEISRDSILGTKALQIIPRLVDGTGTPVSFSGAGLETIMEVYSNGVKLLSSKNLMTDNNFKGFTLRFASLPKGKILDNKVDVKVSVKTTKKTIQFTKAGIPINPKALLMPAGNPTENPANVGTDIVTVPIDNATIPEPPVTPAPVGDPKTTVSRFLNHLSSQNLRAAYDISENPNWGSYENFSNPTSGFGSVKSLSVKNISTVTTGNNSSNVSATYDVIDKNGNNTSLKVTFGLKNINGEWKISSYKIN